MRTRVQGMRDRRYAAFHATQHTVSSLSIRTAHPHTVVQLCCRREHYNSSRMATVWKYLPLVTNKLLELRSEWKRVSDDSNGYIMHHNDNGDTYTLYFIH